MGNLLCESDFRSLWEGGSKNPVNVVCECLQRTPIHQAVKGGHTATAKLLFENGAEPCELDEYKQTPLHYATRGGYIDTTKLILEIQGTFDVF